ncbi:MAG: hypothetical protein IJA33_04110 [Oscillospiraceae bacterium]|nr:hypothetical protein [Oscillospiraceae bacterium]
MPRYEDNQIFSLEDILAEFGSGGAQPAQKEAAPLPVELAGSPAAPDAPPPVHSETAPVPPVKQEEPPDRVSLKDVMQDTVEAVMAEQEDGILAEPPTLRERLTALLSRKERRLHQDTEQLWLTEPLPQPEEPLEPEPDSDDALRLEKRKAAKLRRAAVWSLLPTVFLTVFALVEKLGYLADYLNMLPFLRGCIYGGLLLLSALIAVPAWRFAFEQLRQRRFCYEVGVLLLTVVTLGACACDALAPGGVAPLAAPASALLCGALWGRFLHSRARRDAFRLVALGNVPETVVSPTEAGVCRQKGVIEGFFRLWDVPDTSSTVQNYLLPLLLSTATVLAALVCLSGSCMEQFLWVWSAHLCAALPISFPLCAALPVSLLQHRLGRCGSALAGFAGARAITGRRRLLVTEDDLFPAGAVAFNGYKLYGEERLRMMSYAASMAQAAQSPLYPLFRQQLNAEGGYMTRVDDLHFLEEGGIVGTIHGETVSMGSAYFMRKQKVSLPSDLKLQTGVFLAVDGVLCAIFVIKYRPSRNAEWALRALRRNRIRPVLAVRSANVTPGLIKRKFGVDCRCIYPTVSARLALSDLSHQTGEKPYAALYRHGLLPLTETVIGARRLCAAVRRGTVLSFIAAALGLFLTYYLTAAGRFGALEPLYMLAFLLVWLLPTLLLGGLVKHF